MPKLRVHNFAVSVDGYAAGPDQSLDNPLGVGGRGLHDWVFQTRAGRAMIGSDGGETGADNDFLTARASSGIGATVMGRNMSARSGDPGAMTTGAAGGVTIRPFHHPVFVLTRHPHEPIEMAGGTTFHFVTDGIEAALSLAFDVAAGDDVRLGGGTSTIRAVSASAGCHLGSCRSLAAANGSGDLDVNAAG